MLIYALAAFCAGFALDLAIGAPQGWPHMVRFMGAIVKLLEKALYKYDDKRLSGLLLVIIVCAVCAAVPAALSIAAWIVSSWLYCAIETVLVWQCSAANSLRVESGKVYQALKNGDLSAAKRSLSMIVGRDTEDLDESGIIRAAVETVAENASDGVTAPLLYTAIFGGPGGCLYKAVNTMDSMIGYKNERYADFGRCAAKLDDAVNFIPSRLCAVLMIAAARLCRLDAKGAYRVWRRDRRKHASPNSAQTEAVCAGALGVRLAGNAHYGGVLREKPYIGDETRPIEAGDIRRAHSLLYATAFLTFAFSVLIRGLVYAAF